MTTPYQGWVEGVRSAMGAPPLSRSHKRQPGADPKWAIGDALLAAPEDQRDAVAADAELEKSLARSYWRTAEAWPPHTRTVPASWSAYRELASAEQRFSLICPGMRMRDAHRARTGEPFPDRKAQKNTDDDDLIDELVGLMLSPRSDRIVPQILERLNASKEGRKTARDRRSTAALRRLDEEIRLVQKEVKKRRAETSPGLRFMESRRRLLDTEVNVEEIRLLFNDPDDRRTADAEDWRKLAERVAELRDLADSVARQILVNLDVVDAEGWDAADGWSLQELSGGGDDDIVEAEIVNED